MKDIIEPNHKENMMAEGDKEVEYSTDVFKSGKGKNIIDITKIKNNETGKTRLEK